jgi:phospholipase C
LKIKVTRFQLDVDERARTVEGRFDATSLRVVCAMQNGKESKGTLSAAQKQEVMAYHGVDSLWALHQLGRTFAVCDGWFCSVPGPTWTNRLFAMSGTSQGRVKMPEGIFQPNLHRYDQPSVFLRDRVLGWTMSPAETDSGKNTKGVTEGIALSRDGRKARNGRTTDIPLSYFRHCLARRPTGCAPARRPRRNR